MLVLFPWPPEDTLLFSLDSHHLVPMGDGSKAQDGYQDQWVLKSLTKLTWHLHGTYTLSFQLYCKFSLDYLFYLTQGNGCINHCYKYCLGRMLGKTVSMCSVKMHCFSPQIFFDLRLVASVNAEPNKSDHIRK